MAYIVNYLNGQIIYGNPKDAKVVLSCPFCGGTPVYKEYPIQGYDPWVSAKLGCSYDNIWFEDDTYGTDFNKIDEAKAKMKERLIEKWNRRTTR